ncbi:hypothetical protein FBQ90_05075 [Betaproteobacteria bacterium PRO5]|nr:hypothetical protein [Betaproteobacteria bacterium PRO5]
MSLKIEIASVPDQDDLVAEVWQGDKMVAEIHRSPEESLVLELYPSPNQEPWIFDLEEWMATLSEARRRLR